MSRKKKHPEHVNNERWLVSYADFITLLFAFFVVMFANAQGSSYQKTVMKFNKVFDAAFNRFSVFEFGGSITQNDGGGGAMGRPIGTGTHFPFFIKTHLDKDEFVMSNGGDQKSFTVGEPSTEDHAMALAQKDMQSVLERTKMKGQVAVSTEGGGLTISLKEAGVFELGAEKLTPESEEVLHGVGRMLLRMPDHKIRIEGNTDNRPPVGFDTNWDLSTARANYVLKWLLRNYPLNPANFTTVGYGEFKPIADNSTEEGRKKNRRVDLVLESKKEEEPSEAEKAREKARKSHGWDDEKKREDDPMREHLIEHVPLPFGEDKKKL